LGHRAPPTTASLLCSVANHGLPAGSAFLGKPFSPVELARKVREVLDIEPDLRG
jgi:hypothetical protein